MAACTQNTHSVQSYCLLWYVTYYLGHEDFVGVEFYLLHEKVTKHSPLPLN